MFAFFGDSHSRQFQSALPGRWAHVVFSGATIRGLSSASSALRHGVAVREMANAAFRKHIILMFGGVDLDVTFYRKLAMGEHVGEQGFFESAAASYSRYIDHLLWLGPEKVASVSVLAPQLTPLSDAVFAKATAVMARVEPTAMAAVADRIDCTHLERCRRQVRFNDKLQGALGALPVSFFRIDHQMADADGLISPEFVSRSALDHHANAARTLPLWQAKLSELVPAYARVRKKAEAREKAA